MIHCIEDFVEGWVTDRGCKIVSSGHLKGLREVCADYELKSAKLSVMQKRVEELEESNLQLTRQKQNYVKDRVKKNG